MEPCKANRTEESASICKTSFASKSEIYDARGNGGGNVSPTITGDHQNRVTDYTAIVVTTYTEKRFFEWHEVDNL